MKCPAEVVFFLIVALIFLTMVIVEGVKEFFQRRWGFDRNDEFLLIVLILLSAWDLSLIVKHW